MSAQTHTLPKITFCPPSPERPDTHFDRFAFGNRQPFAVESTFVGVNNAPETNGWKSNGLSFSDFRTMSTSRNKRGVGNDRRLATPAYMLDEKRFRAVTIRFLEMRVGLYKKQAGTEIERMQKVSVLLKKKVEMFLRRLDEHCARFVASTDEAERKQLQRNIVEFDTQARIYREPWCIPQMAKAYYFERLKSVQVGERLGFKGPHVRQILLRLSKLDAQIQSGTDVRWQADPEKEAARAEKEAKLAAERQVKCAANPNYGRAWRIGSHKRYHVNRGIVSPKCAFCTEKVPVGSSSSAGNEPADAQTQPLSVILEQQAERLRRRERKLEQMRLFMANRREVARTAHFGKEKRK